MTVDGWQAHGGQGYISFTHVHTIDTGSCQENWSFPETALRYITLPWTQVDEIAPNMRTCRQPYYIAFYMIWRFCGFLFDRITAMQQRGHLLTVFCMLTACSVGLYEMGNLTKFCFIRRH